MCVQGVRGRGLGGRAALPAAEGPGHPGGSDWLRSDADQHV